MPPPEMYIMSLKAEPTTEGALRAIGLKERPVDQEQGEEAGREKWAARKGERKEERKKQTSAGEDVEKVEPSCIAGGNVKWYCHCGKQFGGSSKT